MLRKKYIPALKQTKREKSRERDFNQNKQKIKSFHLQLKIPQRTYCRAFWYMPNTDTNNQNTVDSLLTDTSIRRTPL